MKTSKPSGEASESSLRSKRNVDRKRPKRGGPRTGLMPPGRPGQQENIAERQRQAMELRKAGGSYRAIARELGIGVSQAYADVQTVLREVIELRDRDAEEYREQELERLDSLLLSIWPRAKKGDVGAVGEARKIGESRRRLLGLDAPAKVAPTDPSGKRPYQPDLSKLTDEELALGERIVGKIAPPG